MTSIAQLIKASEYACTGSYPIQASNELSIALYLPSACLLSLLLSLPPSLSLSIQIYLCLGRQYPRGVSVRRGRDSLRRRLPRRVRRPRIHQAAYRPGIYLFNAVRSSWCYCLP